MPSSLSSGAPHIHTKYKDADRHHHHHHDIFLGAHGLFGFLLLYYYTPRLKRHVIMNWLQTSVILPFSSQ